MFSVTHSLTPACISLLCSLGSELFDFQNKTANKRKTEKNEVNSVKWYLKCNSLSLFTSSITSLCNHMWIQSCIQSSGSLPLYTWLVTLISLQTRKKMKQTIMWNPELAPSYAVVTLFISMFDFCKKNIYLVKIVGRKIYKLFKESHWWSNLFSEKQMQKVYRYSCIFAKLAAVIMREGKMVILCIFCTRMNFEYIHASTGRTFLMYSYKEMKKKQTYLHLYFHSNALTSHVSSEYILNSGCSALNLRMNVENLKKSPRYSVGIAGFCRGHCKQGSFKILGSVSASMFLNLTCSVLQLIFRVGVLPSTDKK